MGPGDPAEARALVDQIAMVFESAGLPPVSGLILGRLLMCDPPEQSSAQLAEYCQASRGAISTATRLLIRAGFVERVRVRGSRAAWFRIRENCWSYALHAEILRVKTLRQLGDRGLELLAGESPERMARMREFRDVQVFFEMELPAVIERWDRSREDESC